MQEATYIDRVAGGETAIAYTDWGDPDNPDVVFCVHGLTRNSRDFDVLAEALSATRRVICVDVPGRGKSDWLDQPGDYNNPHYCAVLARLITHLGLASVDWIGTSMGGIIGMMVAALPNTPVRRLVVNDVGPVLPATALQRINSYLSLDFSFTSLEELERHLRTVHEPFGPLTDAQWAHLARFSSRQDAAGRWRLNYDPAIKVAFKQLAAEDIVFWEVWDAISCPVLVLRGEASDILLPETAMDMTKRGPGARLVTFPGIGHAPALMEAGQIETIRDWLSHPG